MTKHAKLSASSAHRWMNCPGSIMTIRPRIEEIESSYASEGTKAHEIAAQCLKDNTNSEDRAIQSYLDYVRSLEGVLHIEERLELTADMWGTVDALVVSGTHIHVVDFKYGQGVAVSAKDNPQLLYYALAASMFYPNVTTFTLTISQPRMGNFSTWDVSGDMLEVFSKRLKEAVIATQSPTAPLVTGEHCRFCPAQAYCSALYEVAVTSAINDFTDIAKCLDLVEVLKPWIKAVEAFAMTQALKGIAIPGYSLVDKRYNRVWNDFTEEILVSRFGEAAFEPKTLLSPAKLEKIGDIDGLWHRQNSGGKRIIKNENTNTEISRFFSGNIRTLRIRGTGTEVLSDDAI